MLKRGRAAAAEPGAGREGVKKGEAEHPGGRAAARAARDRARGSRLAQGTKGQGPSSAGLGAGGAGPAAGLRVQRHPEMGAIGGGTDAVPTPGPAGDVAIQC